MQTIYMDMPPARQRARYDTVERQMHRGRRQKRRRARRVPNALILAAIILVLGALAGTVYLVASRTAKGGMQEASAIQAPGEAPPPSLAEPDAGQFTSGYSELTELAAQYPELSAVLAAPAEYPQPLVELFLRNQETLPCLLGYPARGEGGNVDIGYEAAGGQTPLFLQWDSRWGYETYGDGLMAVTGCGPTCLSMVAVSLTGDVQLHPLAVARYSEDNGYYMPGTGSAWSLMVEGASGLGLHSEEIPLSENTVYETLQSGRPIICSVGPGDFTTAGHFIVLAGIATDGNITVYDPSSALRSAQSWPYETLEGQIRNLWAYSV